MEPSSPFGEMRPPSRIRAGTASRGTSVGEVTFWHVQKSGSGSQIRPSPVVAGMKPPLPHDTPLSPEFLAKGRGGLSGDPPVLVIVV
jgi:hypothetical protein